jgi:hypothetical protein
MKRTSRHDPVNNRNTIIMGNFAKNRLGYFAGIFDDLPFPDQTAGKVFSMPIRMLHTSRFSVMSQRGGVRHGKEFTAVSTGFPANFPK